MDFSAYPRLPGRDAWPPGRISDRLLPGNQSTITGGKIIPYPWQSHSEKTQSELFLQSSSAWGMSIQAGHGMPPPPPPPPGEYISAVADSSCALSLLSNQPWGLRSDRSSSSGLGVHWNAPPMAQQPPMAPHGGTFNQFPTSWGIKDDIPGSSSHQNLPNIGLGQVSPPLAPNQFSSESELSSQSRRPYMELGHPRDFDANQHMPWSL